MSKADEGSQGFNPNRLNRFILFNRCHRKKMQKKKRLTTDDFPELMAKHSRKGFAEPEAYLYWLAMMEAHGDRIERLKLQLDERDKEIAKLNQTLQEIFDSTSWKVSAPLRWLRKSAHADNIIATCRNAYADLKSKVQHKLENPPEPKVFQGLDHFGSKVDIDPSRETVLIVTHEASRTGAPILSLNLAKGFHKKYNVVSLLLGLGALVDDFKRNSDIVIGPIENRYDELSVSNIVDKLLDYLDIRFAIVNSIESRNVLPALGRRFVPTVALIHEFAAYTRPREAFIQATFWATKVVFPDEIIRENAISHHPELVGNHSLILPQGRCLLSEVTANRVSTSAEREAISKVFRPVNKQPETIVILGAGSVHFRKGVDIFLDCAVHIARSNFRDTCRFVWVGGGFDPEHDADYSAYLADQIQRSGLENQVAFLDEVSEMDYAYEQADILLLSSRLDPLPNVAIDSMFHGIPVLCMDQTTGIAGLLKKNGLSEECVAPYLDVEALSMKLSRLIESPNYRIMVGEKLKALAPTLFDMDTYIETLDKQGIQAMAQTLQEREDCLQIIKSGCFDPDISPPIQPNNAVPPLNSIREYVRAWASQVGRRNPYQGFNADIYLEQRGNEVAGEPYADYLRSGKPSGPWLTEDILPETMVEVKDNA